MRIFFSKKGTQEKFIKKILSRISIKDTAKLCNLSERTIRDWRREKFLMNLDALRKICKKIDIKFPSNIELRNDYWYVVHGSSAGGLAVYKKYGRIGGDPKYRKKKWYEWWEREGKYKVKFINAPKPILKPKYSEKVAEFVGILLGDGGIAQYQVVVTLHSEDDKEYSKFIIGLVKELFNVPVGIHYDKECASIDLVVSRSELVRFCIEKLGLKKGSKVKQQVDIPNWIKQNKSYSIACLRGLIDTDGCVFTHRYRANGKMYSYKKLAFSNHSKPILKSVYQFLQILGMNPRITKDEKDVRLESIKDLQQYFLIINSHNSKILQQYRK